jgi:hypothetical protein
VAVAGKLYALGGRIRGGLTTQTVERYSPAFDVWEPVAPMHTPRMSLAAVVYAM